MNKTVTVTVQGWTGAPRTEAGPHSEDVHSKGGRRCVHSNLYVQPDRRVCAVLPQWQEDTTSIQASNASHKDTNTQNNVAVGNEAALLLCIWESGSNQC